MEVSKTQKQKVAVVVTLGLFMPLLDNSIVSVALPQMQVSFQTNFAIITWVATAYFLAQAGIIPIVGYLSDRIGSKRVFLTAATVFTVSSLLCALSPTKEVLITFRVLQGIGGGALLPVGFAIMYRTFPPSERGRATAIMGAPIMMAPSLGPFIGGYLSSNWNWNAIFAINIPFGILALLLALRILPGGKSEQTGGAKKHVDMPGLVLSMVGFSTLVYSISLASSNGWADRTVLTTLLIGIIVLAAFVAVELRVSDPVLDLRLFTNYTFAMANLLVWIIVAMIFTYLFLLPFFFENVQGNSAQTTGLFLLGQGVAAGVGITISGRLYNRVGPRTLALFGLLFTIGGTYGLTQINVNTTGQSLQIWMLLLALGAGIVNQPLQILAVSVVSNRGMAKASSLVSATRQVATAFGVAALATYMTQQAATHATEISNALQAGLKTNQLTGVAATCVQGAGPTLNQAAIKACVQQHALTTGITDAFWIILICYVGAFLLALTVGRDPTLEAAKQEKAPVEKGSTAGIDHVISTLTDNGEEIMGPEMLLWRYPEDTVMNGSLLVVESNHFCVLKSLGTILDIYETGRYIVQPPDHSFGSMQVTFSSEPIPWQYEALYINRAELQGKASGVALSLEMAEVDYHVDYFIHLATKEDVTLLVQRIPRRGHTLTIEEINTYAGPVIEQAVNQLLRSTPLGLVGSGFASDQGQQMQKLSQLVHQYLQPLLSIYGITLGTVNVFVSPRDEHTKALISLKACGLSERDAIHYHLERINNHTKSQIQQQGKQAEQKMYMTWRKSLERYKDEIVALQAELERTHADLSLHVDAHNTHLQKLLHAISDDLLANAPDLEITPLSDVAPLSKPQILSQTGQFRAINRNVSTVTENV